MYLFDASGACVAQATTDASGRYAFGGLADGGYRVAMASPSWWSLREDWVPTTTGSLQPSQAVQVSGGPAESDMGWRPVARSTSAPLTAFAGPDGLRTESYDDVEDARTLYDALERGKVGAEAGSVVVRFDDGGTGGNTVTSVQQGSDGRYTGYAAV